MRSDRNTWNYINEREALTCMHIEKRQQEKTLACPEEAKEQNRLAWWGNAMQYSESISGANKYSLSKVKLPEK